MWIMKLVNKNSAVMYTRTSSYKSIFQYQHANFLVWALLFGLGRDTSSKMIILGISVLP